MKAMYCMKCGTIRSPERYGEQFYECECGNMRVKWLDPQKGRLLILAKNLASSRVIGMNNQMLMESMRATAPSDLEWREAHKRICDDSAGYIFQSEKRGCWACLVRAGDTTDITWVHVKDDWTPVLEGITIPDK